MLNSAIVANINSLTVGKQVTTSSNSSLLASHIEFTSGENATALATQMLQSKYPLENKKKDDKALNGEVTFNGQVKTSNGMDQNKNPQGKHIVMNGNHDCHSQGDGVPNPRICLYPQGKMHLEWKQIHKIGAGLVNLGNTCFMNTVIQCLTYCPPLTNYLLHDEDHAAKCKITGFCMMCELQKHMKRALDRPGDIIKPLYIYQKLKSIAKHFQFGRQEDAHEFLRYVIDNLWKAALFNYDGNAKLDPASKETTVINHIFGGYHRSQVVCLRCREKSNTYDHFMDFILDIKQNVQSLEKALEKFIQPELLQNDNAYKCPRCNIKVSAQKRFTVHRPPNVATFQFKRFDYNRMFGGKITKHVSYPEKLDLRPYMSDTKGGPVVYRLNAVLVHLGPSCNSGHYFCYVRNSNGYWYLMDDARVHQVSVNQVLNQQAYVLFYIRIAAQGANLVKKSLSTLSTNHKTTEGLKNGPLGHSSLDSAGKPVSKCSGIPKTTSSPAIIRVSSSTSPIVVNGNAYGVSTKLPLSQNREKVTFGIRRPELGTKASLNKSHQTNSVKSLPASRTNDSGKTCLVPYAGDSSESSDEEHRKTKLIKISNSKTNSKTTHGEEKLEIISTLRNSNKTVIESKKENIRSPSQNSNETVGVSEPKLLNDSIEKKPTTVHKTLSPFVNGSESSSSQAKVKATFPWHVSDASLHSPSVASGSSTNSVNSTADWTVTEQQENTIKSKCERTYPGWTVTQSDKSNQDQSVKMKGPSVPQKIKLRFSLSNNSSLENSNKEQLEDPCNSEIAPQSEHNESSPHTNSVENGDVPAQIDKEKECSASSEKRVTNTETNDVSSEHVKSDTCANSQDLKSDNQSFHESFRNSEVDHNSIVSKRSKKHKSSDSEKRNSQSSPDKRTSKDVVSDLHKDSGSKWESKLPNNDETSYYPVPKKCKGTYDEHEEREEESKHNERINKKAENKKNFNKQVPNHSNEQKDCKSDKKHNHKKYGSNQSRNKNDYYNSLYNMKNKKYYNHQKDHYKEKYNDNHWSHNNKMKYRTFMFDDNLPANVWRNNNSFKVRNDSSYRNSDSDNSSCSYEMEWVEKTKETVEAERKSSGSVKVPFKYWNSGIKDGFSKERNDNSNYKLCWNGRPKNDVINELQKHSSKGYGTEVNSWDGNKNYLERELLQDSFQKRDHYDDYDEDYDRGKIKKVKKWQKNVPRTYLYNQFQTFWDSRRNEKYQNKAYRKSNYFPGRKSFNNNNNYYRQWNYSK